MKSPHPLLPPGFRFHPTDEELILHYLQKRASSAHLPVSIIAEVDIYKFDPWDLPAMAAFGEKEWYFFSPRDRKYPNGARPNRAAASGYWKATGTDKIIMAPSPVTAGERNERNIGVKKALVFYKGRPPRGIKTNWIMHEYRLAESPCTLGRLNESSSMRLDDWVLCRIYRRSNVLLAPAAVTTTPMMNRDYDEEQQQSHPAAARDHSEPLPESTLSAQKSSSFSNLLDAMDYAMLSRFLSETDTPGDHPNNSLSFLQDSGGCSALENNHGLLAAAFAAGGQSGPVTGGALKRQRSGTEVGLQPSMKLTSSATTCSFQISGGVAQLDTTWQYNHMMGNHSLLNQQLLLSPNVQFLG
ncbi:hypothetical protein SAY86_010548 [Trapa natans]|uniref:NAC domain-containing protein n=1 Tax=Trapa natans TaxID=22666 RepID=A0AAN7LSH5_TRANT|nr:hypothetical protein SAY86_010548 [Trapa natans]